MYVYILYIQCFKPSRHPESVIIILLFSNNKTRGMKNIVVNSNIMKLKSNNKITII